MFFSVAVEGMFLQLIRTVVELFYLLQTERVSFNTNTYQASLQPWNRFFISNDIYCLFMTRWLQCQLQISSFYIPINRSSSPILIFMMNMYDITVCPASLLFTVSKRERERECICVCVFVCIPFSAWNTYFVMTDEHSTDPQQYFNGMHVRVMFLVKTQRFE